MFLDVEARPLAVVWEASSVESLVCRGSLVFRDQDNYTFFVASMPSLSGWLLGVPTFSGFGGSPTAAAPAPSSSPEWPSDAGKKLLLLIYLTNPVKIQTNSQEPQTCQTWLEWKE